MFKFENSSQLRSYNSFMNLAEYLADSTSFDAENIKLGFYKLFLYSEYIYHADFNTLTVNEKMLKSVYDEVGLYDMNFTLIEQWNLSLIEQLAEGKIKLKYID